MAQVGASDVDAAAGCAVTGAGAAGAVGGEAIRDEETKGSRAS